MAELESWTRPIALMFAGHLFAGVALALGDRFLSRPHPESHRRRLERKRDALVLLDYLRDLGAGGPEADVEPTPSTEEVREACAYIRELIDRGELEIVEAAHPQTAARPLVPPAAADEPAWERAWHRLLDWFRYEKINQLAVMTKLKVAYSIELLADIGVAVSAIFWGRGNFLHAIGHSLYQGAALWIGLVAGGFLFRRHDHRAPRRLRKEVERLEERLASDPMSTELLARIMRNEEVWRLTDASRGPAIGPRAPHRAPTEPGV